MTKPTATFEATAIDPAKGRFTVTVTIGTPYLSETEPHVWRCPVSIDPLYPRLSDIAGDNSFQALCLASRLAIDLLQGFIEKGGRITHDDEDVPLDAYIPLPPRT